MAEVIGLFANDRAAESAVDALYSLGYDATNVGYLDRREETGEVIADRGFDDDADHTEGAGEEAAKGAGGGAIGGAAVGAGAGLLASAGMLLVPGAGPFLAAGTLAATLGGAAAGAAGGAVVGGATGAILGLAKDDGADDETSSYYREGVERGSSLVTVEVLEGQQNEVAEILRDAQAEKVDVYGGTGWM